MATNRITKRRSATNGEANNVATNDLDDGVDGRCSTEETDDDGEVMEATGSSDEEDILIGADLDLDK